MATRKIKDAKDLSTQELIYFKGHAKATFMSDGATVEDAVRAVENATYKNKGYFPTLAELQSAFPEGSAGSRAYVGSTYPYSIYLWQNGAWVDSGATGGDESVDLASYYTKSETDTKLTELSNELGAVSLDLIGAFSTNIPSSGAGWTFYPMPSIKKGVEYTLQVSLSESAPNPVYWNLYNNGSGLFGDAYIGVGVTSSSKVFTPSEDIASLSLALYSGGNIPPLNFKILPKSSELSEIRDSINALDVSIEQTSQGLNGISKDCDNVMLASSRYFYHKDNISERTTYPQVLNGQHKGVVNGVKISIGIAGTIVLTLAKGTNTNTPTFTTIQSFPVKKGVNYLYFDKPVNLEENEGIGVDPSSTAAYHRAYYGNTDIGSRYFNGSNWEGLVNGVVMATFATDSSDTLARLKNTENDIDSLSQDVKDVVDGDHYVTLLGSARFGKVTTLEKPTAYVFVDGQDQLVGKTIVGMKISISKAGTIVLSKCTGYKKPSPSFTDLQTFNVKVGENYLLLNTPIVLNDGEAFGVAPSSTASYHRGGYDSTFNKGYYYYNGGWDMSGADLVMAILGNELPKDKGTEEMESQKTELNKVKSATLSSVVYPTTPPLLYSHLFIDKIYTGSNTTIPSQSVFDVMVAAAMGFKMLEINVMLTSDGVPVTGHQVNGKLETLANLSGTPVAVDVASTTFAKLRNDYRYHSVFPQFRTPITSLEECLLECQRYGITPFVQCVNQSVIDLTESIVGKRYVAYGAKRTQTDATICAFSNDATIEQLLASCDSVGYPYILGVGANILDNLSDAEIKVLVANVHAKGCWINWAGAYHTAPSNMRMKRLGLDSCASGWEVPEFNEYDVRKMGDAVKGWESFTGTFTKASDSASLSNGQTISADIPQLGIIAKSQLAIHFKGKLTINFGKVNASFESDGNSIMVMTSVVENADADIVITSEGTSTIYSIDYKTASVL